ncbi:MAG: hypothetical protein AB3N64_02375 [Puniceicoccaceae bacterium]
MSELKKWAIVILVVSALLILFNEPNPHGDASEYQAMLVALAETGRPWMTDASWEAYDDLRENGALAKFLPGDSPVLYLPQLEKNGQRDFPHFWFYSLLGSIIWKPLAWTGLGPTGAFLILHALLFLGAGYLIRRLFGWRGFLVYAGLVVFSPAIWYINKVHTEFFTVTVSLAAVALLMRSHYLYAGLCFAALSTQNPAFAIPAALSLLPLWKSPFQRQFNLVHVLLFALVVLLVAIHPVYYMVRYGAPTPQLLTGSAKLAEGATGTFWIPFLDLNLGLFPNWPLGLVLTIAVVWVAIRMRKLPPVGLSAICLLASLFLLYASSKTTHFNHGMTVGLSRYALWHICFFFPLFYWLQASMIIEGKVRRRVVVALLVLLGGSHLLSYHPYKEERYVYHTPLAAAVIKFFPGLYTPHPEIFTVRTINRLGYYDFEGWAIVQDDQWLIFRDKMPHGSVPLPQGTKFPAYKARIDTTLLDEDYGIRRHSEFYKYLPQRQEKLARYIEKGEPVRSLSLADTGIEPMLQGDWHLPEATGRWTGQEASIRIGELMPQALRVKIHGNTFGDRPFDVFWNNRLVFQRTDSGTTSSIFFDLESADIRNVNELKIVCPLATSPSKVMESEDSRILGMFVHMVEFSSPVDGTSAQ